jgi:hypothetical protein
VALKMNETEPKLKQLDKIYKSFTVPSLNEICPLDGFPFF